DIRDDDRSLDILVFLQNSHDFRPPDNNPRSFIDTENPVEEKLISIATISQFAASSTCDAMKRAL
ncbi:MAG: hypothetical protein LQ348_000548, partial [Seirophora lacunosa]